MRRRAFRRSCSRPPGSSRPGRRARSKMAGLAVEPTSIDRQASRPRPLPARLPTRWDELSFTPESDPLPLDLLDELGGKDVELIVINAAVRPTFSGEKSVTLTCRVLRD